MDVTNLKLSELASMDLKKLSEAEFQVLYRICKRVTNRDYYIKKKEKFTTNA